MNGRDSSSDSFDPLSWGRSAGPTAAPKTEPPGPEETSFDPSTWAQPEAAARPEASVSKQDAAPPSAPRDRKPLIAAASGFAILFAGAAAAWMTGSPVQPASPPTASSDQPLAAGHSRRTFTIAGPDQILDSLTDMDIDPQTARSVAQQLLAAVGPAPGEIRLDAQLASQPGGGMTLAAIEATRADGSGVFLTAAADGSFTAEKLDTRLTTQIVSARGEMDTNSFYSSAVTAGISDSVISDFAAAFSFEVDFQREVKPGDIFEAAFEQAYNPSGEPIGTPRLLFASLRLENKSLRLYRFKPPGAVEPGWFDANGSSNIRSLMRTPLDGARVSSQFGYRIHPVHGGKRLHRGTDFAAPVGTRVYASADGEVVTAGPNRCAGNMVRIQHEKGRRTHYFHLSAFSPGVQPGVNVRQGEVIGLVGNTGTCTTGPHLHYEVWIDDEPVDALTLDTGTGVTLEGAGLNAFKQERDRIDLARSQRVE